MPPPKDAASPLAGLAGAVVTPLIPLFPILNKVSMWVLDGWPTVKPDNLNSELSAFWERKDYLTLELDCLTWGNRVIIPTSHPRRHLLDLVGCYRWTRETL